MARLPRFLLAAFILVGTVALMGGNDPVTSSRVDPSFGTNAPALVFQLGANGKRIGPTATFRADLVPPCSATPTIAPCHQ